jgi:hypothetical protein
MAFVSRGQALIRTAAAAASADYPRLHAYPLDKPAGCRTHPVWPLLAEKFPGTNKLLFQLLDPKLVKFQFLGSTITNGVRSGGVLYKVSEPVISMLRRPDLLPRRPPPTGRFCLIC